MEGIMRGWGGGKSSSIVRYVGVGLPLQIDFHSPLVLYMYYASYLTTHTTDA